MKQVEELCPEALFDLDEIEALPAFDAPDFPAVAFSFTETETSSATACTYIVTVANLEAYNGGIWYAQSPLGTMTYLELLKVLGITFAGGVAITAGTVAYELNSVGSDGTKATAATIPGTRFTFVGKNYWELTEAGRWICDVHESFHQNAYGELMAYRGELAEINIMLDRGRFGSDSIFGREGRKLTKCEIDELEKMKTNALRQIDYFKLSLIGRVKYGWHRFWSP